MRRFGLIGKTLKHSFSQTYFAEKFKKEHIKDCSYENFELQSIEQLQQLVDRDPDLEGLNVTIPYKQEVIPFLHTSDDIVSAVGACNCIRISNQKLYGFNTDSPAFRASLSKELRSHHSKALVLGTGGASKAVQFALQQLGISFQIVSRTNSRSAISYQDLDEEIMTTHTVIINTTPVGMYPHVEDEVPLPYRFITPEYLLFDLVYNPVKTKFLSRGEEKGAQIKNGWEMLVLQAEESWKIWNDL